MAQTTKVRKIPQRKCVACSERGDKKKLVRVVRNKDGEVFLDRTSKANGRGAYVHLSKECIEKAVKTKALERSIKAEIPADVVEALREELKKDEG